MESPPSWAVCLLTILASAALLRAVIASRQKKLKPPPGPRPWPVIGNLNLIGALPHRSIHHLSLKYGPIMQIYLGSQRVVVGSSVEMAEQVLKTHDAVFSSRPRTAAGKYTSYNYSTIGWSSYGPYWRLARRMCFAELFSPKRIDSFQSHRVEEIRQLLRGLSASSGRAVTLRDHLFTVTLNIISRMALGKAYTNGCAAEASVVSPGELKEMLEELLLLDGVINVGDLIPWIGFLDLQGYVRRMKAVSKKLDRFLEHVLNVHEERRRQRGVDFVPRDMVDVLLQHSDDPNLDVKLTRDRIKGFMQDLFAGGVDTSPLTVEWAMAELLRRPHIFHKAAHEIDRVVGRERWVEEKDLPDLPYLEAIVKETMRLHPVAPLLIPRYSREQCNVSGYDIPAGTMVFVNVWAIGRDPAVWDSPGEFRPERFEGKEMDVRGHHFQLLPFGAGRRMCPGYLLGLKIVQSSLANLLHGFTWRLPEGTTAEDLNMEEVCGLTLPRKFPLVVVAEPRLPAHLYNL